MIWLSYATLMCCSFHLVLSLNSMGLLKTGYEKISTLDSTRNDLRRESEHILLKRSASNIVDIARFTQRRNQMNDYSIYVDSTIRRLIIEIAADRSIPISSLVKPLGVPGPNATVTGTIISTVTASYDVPITSKDYGLWKLKKSDASAWNVKIQGESTVDFTYQFLEGTLNQRHIMGDPIQGETYKTVVNVTDPGKIRTVEIFLVFVTEKSKPADIKFPVVAKGGGRYELAKLKMLNRDFMIGIQGKDNSGKTFRRIQLVKPIALLLSVPLFTDPTIKLHEYTKLEISFTVTNKLKTDQDIHVSITDTGNLVVDLRNFSATLKPNGTYTGKFGIDGGHIGDETLVTITVQRLNGTRFINVWPSVKRRFIVESNQTTTTSTSITPGITTDSTASAFSTLVPSTASKSMLTSITVVLSSAGVPIGSGMQDSHKQTTGDAFSVTTSQRQKSVQITTHSRYNKRTVATQNNENKEEKSIGTKDLFGAAAISGLSAGASIGLAALVTICLLFKNFNKNKITPKDDNNRKSSLSHTDLKWT